MLVMVGVVLAAAVHVRYESNSKVWGVVGSSQLRLQSLMVMLTQVLQPLPYYLPFLDYIPS